jgi:hypothetical protein
MPWQLIYTSAPRGLHSGQSGFCTVARSADLREALVQRLEQISSYHYLNAAEAATSNRNPTICAFRILDLRGTKYHVLTRIQPCGLDFTSRTNHLAHHLVFQAGELGQLPSPASILRYWDGWVVSWQEEPRLFGDLPSEAFGAAARFCLPAQTWMQVTGDAGRAAGLLESDCIRGCYLVCPTGGEGQVLDMFCETLQLLNLNGQYSLRPWCHPFTTFLQAEDNAADFQWRACQEGTPGYQQAIMQSALLLPLASVRVPANSLASTARHGPNPPAPPLVASPESAPGALRPEDGGPPAAGPGSMPAHPPNTFQRSSLHSLILAYRKILASTTVKQPQTMMQKWFSNRSAAWRAGIGLFAALLGLVAMIHWGCNRRATSNSAPAAPPAQVPGLPAPRAGNPAGSAAEPTPPPSPVPAQMEPVDPSQWAWLLDGGQTFVFAATDFARFELPMGSISQFQRLIRSFDLYQTLPGDIQLLVNTNIWDSQSGERLTVKPWYAHELSAQSARGLGVLFGYADFISTNARPVVVQTTLAIPPRALSVHFSYSSDAQPFRLLIFNQANPPGPAHLKARWLQAGLAERLISKFTFPQGQQLQLLSSSELKGRITVLDQELARLAAAADYPLGKDLGLPDQLASFARWTRSPPTQALFLKYLGELRDAGEISNDWVKEWPDLSSGDAGETLNIKFQKLHELWIQHVPAAKTNADFHNYFYTTWLNLKVLEETRQSKERLAAEASAVAGVGLFITDPGQPGRPVEVFRFDLP